MSDQGNAKRRKSVWKQIKHSVVGSKKEREKQRLHQLMEEHPNTGKAAGFGVAPRNSIVRSPEATKMVFEEFEHSSPSEPGYFDIDDEMGGADVTEDSRPPRKVPPPETPTPKLINSLPHEDEGIAKDPVMGEGTPAVALEGQYPLAPGMTASAESRLGGISSTSTSKPPKRTPTSSAMKSITKAPIGSLTQQNTISRRGDRKTPSTSSLIPELPGEQERGREGGEVEGEDGTGIKTREGYGQALESRPSPSASPASPSKGHPSPSHADVEVQQGQLLTPMPGDPHLHGAPMPTLMSTPGRSRGTTDGYSHSLASENANTRSHPSPLLAGVPPRDKGEVAPPSPDSPEYHYLMNPTHAHIEHRQRVDHEEHHVVGGEMVPAHTHSEHGSDSGAALHGYAASVGVVARSQPDSPGGLGARAKRQINSPGSPAHTAHVARQAHELSARKAAQEADRLKAEREVRALTLYALQMREMLEGERPYPVVDMNPLPPPPAPAPAPAPSINSDPSFRASRGDVGVLEGEADYLLRHQDHTSPASAPAPAPPVSSDATSVALKGEANVLLEQQQNILLHEQAEAASAAPVPAPAPSLSSDVSFRALKSEVDELLAQQQQQQQQQHPPAPAQSPAPALPAIVQPVQEASTDVRVDATHSLSKAARVEATLSRLQESIRPAVDEAMSSGEDSILTRVNAMQQWLLTAQLAWRDENEENESLLRNIRLLADRCKAVAIQNMALRSVNEQLAECVRKRDERQAELEAIAVSDRKILIQRCISEQHDREEEHLLLEKARAEKEEKDKHLTSVLRSEMELKDRVRRHDMDVEDVKREARATETRLRGEIEAMGSGHGEEVARLKAAHAEELRQLQEQYRDAEMEREALHEIVEEERESHQTLSSAHREREQLLLRDRTTAQEAERRRVSLLRKELAGATAHAKLLMTDRTRLFEALNAAEERNQKQQRELEALSQGLRHKRKSLDYHESALLTAKRVMGEILSGVKGMEEEMTAMRGHRARLTAALAAESDNLALIKKACSRIPSLIQEAVSGATLPAFRHASKAVAELVAVSTSLEAQRNHISQAVAKGLRRHQRVVTQHTRSTQSLARAREVGRETQLEISRLAEALSSAEYQAGEWETRHRELSQKCREAEGRGEELEKVGVRLRGVVGGLEERLRSSEQQVTAVGAVLATTQADLKKALVSGAVHAKAELDARQLCDSLSRELESTKAALQKQLEDQAQHLNGRISGLEQTCDALYADKQLVEQEREGLRRKLRLLQRRFTKHKAVTDAALERSAMASRAAHTEKRVYGDLLMQQTEYANRLHGNILESRIGYADLMGAVSTLGERMRGEVEVVEGKRAAYKRSVEEERARLEGTIESLVGDTSRISRDAAALGKQLCGVLNAVVEALATFPKRGHQWSDFSSSQHPVYKLIGDLTRAVELCCGAETQQLCDYADQTGTTVTFQQEAHAPSALLALHSRGVPAAEEEAKTWAQAFLEHGERLLADKEEELGALQGRYDELRDALDSKVKYIHLVHGLLGDLGEPLVLLRENLELDESHFEDPAVVQMAADKLSSALNTHKDAHGDKHADSAAEAEEVLSLARVWAQLHSINERMHRYRDDLRAVVSDMHNSTASRLQREMALDERLHALDSDYHADEDLQHELDAFQDLNAGTDTVGSVKVSLDSKFHGMLEKGAALQRRSSQTMSMGKLVSLMMEAAEASLETECAHNLKLGECIAAEIKKRRAGDSVIRQLQEEVESLKEEKQYLAHLRENLEYQLEGQDRHMALMRDSRSTSAASPSFTESKSNDPDLVVPLEDAVTFGAGASDALGATIVAGVSDTMIGAGASPGFTSRRTEREFHRIKAELRKERLRAEKLQGQLLKTEQERASFHGLSKAKTEEIEGLREDIVALVGKVQQGEQALLRRTGMYEAAIAQVEKLSVRATKEKRSRKGMEEVMRGLDLHLAASGVGGGVSPLRPSRKFASSSRKRRGATETSRSPGRSPARSSASATGIAALGTLMRSRDHEDVSP